MEALIKLARAESERFLTGQSIKSRGILDVFPAFDAEERAEKIRSSAADDLFRGSPDMPLPEH